MALSKDQVLEKVREVLTSALGVDEDEVVPEATLQGDLGAESIDYLDIVFRLEKSFGIKIPQGELFPDDFVNNPEFVEGDRLTPKGLQHLKAVMPHAEFGKFEREPLVSKMPDLFTVRTICNYIQSKAGATAAGAS